MFNGPRRFVGPHLVPLTCIEDFASIFCKTFIISKQYIAKFVSPSIIA